MVIRKLIAIARSIPREICVVPPAALHAAFKEVPLSKDPASPQGPTTNSPTREPQKIAAAIECTSSFGILEASLSRRTGVIRNLRCARYERRRQEDRCVADNREISRAARPLHSVEGIRTRWVVVFFGLQIDGVRWMPRIHAAFTVLYFSDRGRLLQADRGRRFSAIV